MKRMIGYKGHVEPHHIDRKWLTADINLTFDKPIDLSSLIGFIHENTASLEKHCKAKVMVATTMPQMEEWHQSILAHHGLLKEYLGDAEHLHSSNQGENMSEWTRTRITMRERWIEQHLEHALIQLGIGLSHCPKDITMLTVKSIIEKTLTFYREVRGLQGSANK